MKKKQIVTGLIINRDPKTKEFTRTEEITTDWTPELQKAKDERDKNFAQFLYEMMNRDLVEYERTGGDINNKDPHHIYNHLKKVRKEKE